MVFHMALKKELGLLLNLGHWLGDTVPNRMQEKKPVSAGLTSGTRFSIGPVCHVKTTHGSEMLKRVATSGGGGILWRKAKLPEGPTTQGCC